MYKRCFNKIKEKCVDVPHWVKVVVILFVITLVSAVIRFYQIGKMPFWIDEIYTMLFVGGDMRQMFEVMWPGEMNMALYYLVVNFWADMFASPSEGVLRIISAAFSIMSIPAVFFLGRKISADKRIADATGLVAALLVSFNAFHVQYAQELRSYSLVFLLAVLSTLLFIKAIEKPNLLKYWVWYTIVSIAAIYSHYFAVFLIFAHAVSLLVLFVGKVKNLPLKRLVVSYIAIALSIIPIVSIVLLIGTRNLVWVTRPTFDTLMQFSILVTGNQGIQLLVLYIVAVVVGILVGVSWWQKDVLKNWVSALFAICLFLPAGTALLISSVRTPIFVDRYFLFSVSFLSILAAVGIVKLIYANKIVLKLCGVLTLVLIVVFSISGTRKYFTDYQKENWKDASALLTKNCSGSEHLRLYLPVWTQGFTYYYDKQLKTQNVPLQDNLEELLASEISASIPDSYLSVCLTRRWSWSETVRAGIQQKYPNMTTTRFYGLEVDIFRK